MKRLWKAATARVERTPPLNAKKQVWPNDNSDVSLRTRFSTSAKLISACNVKAVSFCRCRPEGSEQPDRNGRLFTGSAQLLLTEENRLYGTCNESNGTRFIVLDTKLQFVKVYDKTQELEDCACLSLAALVSSSLASTISCSNNLNVLPFAKPFCLASLSSLTVVNFCTSSAKLR